MKDTINRKKRYWVKTMFSPEEMESIFDEVHHRIGTHNFSSLARSLGVTRWTLRGILREVERRNPEKIKVLPDKEKYITFKALGRMCGADSKILARKIKPDAYIYRKPAISADNLDYVIKKYWPVMDARKAEDEECKRKIIECQRGWIRVADVVKALKGRLSRQGVYYLVDRNKLEMVSLCCHSWVRANSPEDVYRLTEKSRKDVL